MNARQFFTSIITKIAPASKASKFQISSLFYAPDLAHPYIYIIPMSRLSPDTHYKYNSKVQLIDDACLPNCSGAPFSKLQVQVHDGELSPGHQQGCCTGCPGQAGTQIVSIMFHVRLRFGGKTYNRQHAAASALANGRAGGAEAVGAGGDGGGKTAVEVSDAEDVGGTALGGAVEAGAGHVGHLALLHLRGEGSDEGGAQGGEGDGELHVEGGLVVGWLVGGCSS